MPRSIAVLPLMVSAVLSFGLEGAGVLAAEESRRDKGNPLSYDPKPSLDYIVRHQNEDGTWFIGMQVNPDVGGGITVGTTALAGMALLDHLETDPDRIRPAIDRALGACLKYVWRSRKSVQDFESVNWGQIYTLQLLGRMARHPAWKDRSEELRKEIQELLPWFYRRRAPGKGWGYNGTFQTAAALLMLRELEEADPSLKFRAETHTEVVDLLRANRSEIGYDYNVGPAKKGKPPPPGKLKTLLDGSAARDGACDYALYRYGKITREEMEEGLQRVVDHREFMWTMRNLTAKGEWPRIRSASPSAYFAFWGYLYTAAAVEACGPERREGWARLLHRDLMMMREPDGTWINLPISATDRSRPKVEFKEDGRRVWRQYERNIEPGSKIYATSMALMAFKHLQAAVRD